MRAVVWILEIEIEEPQVAVTVNLGAHCWGRQTSRFNAVTLSTTEVFCRDSHNTHLSEQTSDRGLVVVRLLMA